LSGAPPRVLLGCALVLGALSLAAPALWLDTDGLVAGFYAHDDCFYYFQIARHLADGQGFTFDGRHQTNGFHPLWLFVITPVFALVPGDAAPLRAVALLETALVAAAGVLAWRTLRGRAGAWAALLAALLLVAQPGALRVVRCGMESSLLLLLLVVTWSAHLAWRAQEGPAPGRALTVGALAAACFLCRLEAGLAVPVLALLERRRLRRWPREALALAAPTLAAAAALVTWYQAAFGVPLPVSGLVKAHWAARGGAAPLWADLLRVPWLGERVFQRVFGPFFLQDSPLGAVLYVAMVAALLALAAARRDWLRAAVRRAAIAFPLWLAALMLLVDKLVLRHMELWHQAPLLLATALLAGALLAAVPRLARGAAWLALAAVAARLPLAWLADGSTAGTRYALDAARWLEAHTPPEARVASWNGGGMLGYFSHRSVVVLDGFANDADYLRRVIRGGRLEAYLREEAIGWIGEPGCGPQPELAPLVARNVRERPGMPVPADEQARVAAAELVVSFHRPDTPDGCPGYALWRR
jgi:hypothetical protein